METEPYLAPISDEARWYAGDFHVHSSESGDARASMDEAAALATSRGLDFIHLAEHNTTSQLQFYGAVQARHPDLLLVPLGFNDALRGVGPAEFGRVLDSLLEQTREQGYEGPVLLVGWFVPDWGDRAPAWSLYLDQMADRTDHAGVSFIDLSAVLPPVATAPDGVYLDGLHPGPRGQVLIADSLLEALAPRPDLEGTNEPGTP